MAVSQTQVSEIEHGEITESDAVRAHRKAPALQPAQRRPGPASD
jgi:hypothetical protein